MPTITAGEVALFRQGTQTQYAEDLLPTFATKYRHGEFDWFKRFGIGLKEVRHAEQEYEYIAPLRVGDAPVIQTHFTGFKERKGATGSMCVFVFEATVAAQKDTKVKVTSTFVVVRQGEEG